MTRPCPVPRCTATLGDDRNICGACSADLEQHLAEMPALAGDLERTMARLRSGSSGAASRETPMPYDLRASEALSQMRAVLVGWTRVLEEDPTRHPADTIGAISAWLLARHARLVAHPAAADIAAEVDSLTRQAQRAIFGSPPRVFLGKCECEADLYAAKGERFLRCPDCGASLDVADLMATAEAEVEVMLLSVRDIVRFVAFLGDHPDTGRTEARINTWVHRGVIKRAGYSAQGRPTYRYKQVKAKLDEGCSTARPG